MHVAGLRSPYAKIDRDPQVVMLMGVSGSGKTTVGLELAQQLGWKFRDADDFHPPANVAKMGAGTPLTDQDRAPWLAAIRSYIEENLASGTSAIVTCSALKERYRSAALPQDKRVRLVHLSGDFDLIRDRMERRQGHFMKAEMLQSQFATLEPPASALTVDVARKPGELVAEIRQVLGV